MDMKSIKKSAGNAVDATKEHFKKNWKRYAIGAGTAIAAGAAGAGAASLLHKKAETATDVDSDVHHVVTPHVDKDADPAVQAAQKKGFYQKGPTEGKYGGDYEGKSKKLMKQEREMSKGIENIKRENETGYNRDYWNKFFERNKK